MENSQEDREIFTVKVGQKKVWAYVTACVTYFNKGGRKLILRARGENIPKAIDAANALKRSFYKDLSFGAISLVEDTVEGERGPRTVSAIEISISLEQSPQ